MDNDNILATTDVEEGCLETNPRLCFNKEGSLLAVTTKNSGIKILANADGLQLLQTLNNEEFHGTKVPALSLVTKDASLSHVASVNETAPLFGATGCLEKILSVPSVLTVPQIKAEMEKILTWLVPVATNTTKAHHGFGWVGEWANTGSALDRRLPGHSDFTLIQTFHYAEKDKTEAYIFDLIVWLHHLVNQARNSVNGNKSPIKSPVRSTVTSSNNSVLVPDKPASIENEHLPAFSELSQEDKDMLKDVNFRKLTPGISKSQEFDSAKVRAAHQAACRLSKSNSHSPTTNTKNDLNGLRQHTTLPTIEFDIDRIQALDVIDRVENLTVL